jgi:hypothetical protein
MHRNWGEIMKRISFLLVAITGVAGITSLALTSGRADEPVSPIYGVGVPTGYRDWKLISVGRLAGSNHDLRAKLGNDIAIKAYREGTIPFPDGAIIARLAWHEATSDENNKALGDGDSFVAGSATNLEFMVKDSKKYAATGGWGFAQFTDGKPDSEALHKTCFSCHAPAKDNDFVFTRYAP